MTARNQRVADRLQSLNKVEGVQEIVVRTTVKERVCFSEQCPQGGTIKTNERYIRVRHEDVREGNPTFHEDCYRWEYTK